VLMLILAIIISQVYIQLFYQEIETT